MVLSISLECSFLQILIFIGQTWFLYAVCIALILLGYIFLSFSNADVRLAKELKIECSYENKVNRTNSTKLRNELKLLRQVLLDNSLVGLSPSRSSSFISKPRWDISIISKSSVVVFFPTTSYTLLFHCKRLSPESRYYVVD